MRIQLCSLLINEAEWIDLCYRQHRDWPNLVKWVFVHGADAAYGQANPDLVTKDGLSTDSTRELLNDIAKQDDRVEVIHHGWMRHPDMAQGKVVGRDRYLRVADTVKPDWLIIADLDEFYPKASQEALGAFLSSDYAKRFDGICLRQREVWRPPSCLVNPLFSREVIGGLWRMHHCHLWKWRWGMRYDRSHVWPQTQQGQLLNAKMDRADLRQGSPQWVHLGWAAQAKTRLAKTRYYTARGEGRRDGRRRWMACRNAWESWRPDDPLPYGASVIPYAGPIPEVFR